MDFCGIWEQLQWMLNVIIFVNRSSCISSITNCSSPLQYNIAHFSCPFEFELEYNNPTLPSGEYLDLLHFNITILSIIVNTLHNYGPVHRLSSQVAKSATGGLVT